MGCWGARTPRSLGAGTVAHRGAAGMDSAVLKWIWSSSLCIWHVLMQPRHFGNAFTLTKLNLNLARGWNGSLGAALGCPGPIHTVHGSLGAAAKPGPWAWGCPPKTQPNRNSPSAPQVAAAQAKSAHRREGRSCECGIKVNLLCDLDLDYCPVMAHLDGLNVTPEGREGR